MKRRNWQTDTAAGGRVKKTLCGVVFVILLALFSAYLALVKHVVTATIIYSTKIDVGKSQVEEQHHDGANAVVSRRRDTVTETETDTTTTSTKSNGGYADWREVAVQLAKLMPEQVLQTLNEDDPFGTRTFAKALNDAETAKGGRNLDISELQRLWPCPANDKRISLPERRDQAKAARFRQGKGFLFFQHLRKAGGTHFCSLAQQNLPKQAIPKYYCMPDYH